MGNPVLVIMIETFSLEEVGWGFAMVQICRVKLIPFASSQMNHAKTFFFGCMGRGEQWLVQPVLGEFSSPRQPCWYS